MELLTGATGYIGGRLMQRLISDGREVRALARNPVALAAEPVEAVKGDVITGEGLREALDGCETAYYLIHSMERAAGPNGRFADLDRRAADNFARAAQEAGVDRLVYLGGLIPQGGEISPHLRSRLEVEEILLDAIPDSVALRASIVIGARSRSFRFLVRLIERIPVLALPAWRENRTAPIDGRDVIEFLARAATAPAALAGRSWDIAGPEVMTYARLIERIADAMVVTRPRLSLGVTLTPIASVVAAVIAGEDPALITPLMEGLESDLLPRHLDAPEAFGVRLHAFDAAVERALREWELTEEVAAR
jgi:uncharacterized protein YbjT (DUF2867 family)